MRFPKTDGQKEWLPVFFQALQRLYGPGRYPAVEISLVRHIANGAARQFDFVPRRLPVDLRLVIVMTRVVHELRHAPRLRVAVNVLPPVVENLANTLGEVAVVPEMLRQRHDARAALAEVCRQVPDAQRVGPQSGQHRGARGIAQRLLAIGTLEHPATLGQAVDVRADHMPGTVAAQFRPQIVRHEKQDIGLVTGRGAGQAQQPHTP